MEPNISPADFGPSMARPGGVMKFQIVYILGEFGQMPRASFKGASCEVKSVH